MPSEPHSSIDAWNSLVDLVDDADLVTLVVGDDVERFFHERHAVGEYLGDRIVFVVHTFTVRIM